MVGKNFEECLLGLGNLDQEDEEAAASYRFSKGFPPWAGSEHAKVSYPCSVRGGGGGGEAGS